MSLEQALAANTAAIEKLVAILANAENAPAIAAPAAEEEISPSMQLRPDKKTRTKKEAQAEAPAGEPAPEANAPSQESTATAAPATARAAAPARDPVSYTEAAEAVTRVIKALGTAEAKALLRCFEAQNLKAVDPSRYGEVIETAEALLKGEITL